MADEKFVTLAQVADVPPGAITKGQADGESMTLVNHEGSFYALQSECLHLGGPLCDGRIEQGHYLTCPWHGWKDDGATGKNDFDLAIQARTFEVRVEGGEIKVGLHT